VAQKWRVTQNQPKTREKRPIPPLDDTRLNDMALHYVARYATTRAKLAAYLRRKLRERGWSGDRPADPDAIVARMAELRYIDDAGFAVMKGAALGRRGYGARRIGEALRADGVEEPDRTDALDSARSGKWMAAETFARRKRIGPFAREPAERDVREKQIAAFLRAGHDFATARAWVHAEPGEMPEEG